MQTLYRTQEIEAKKIEIPQDIQTKINERWFYLYNWIWAKDVKNSIERDFLKLLNYLWIPFALIAVLSFLITFNPLVFIWIIWIFTILFLIYLSILWFFRWIKLSKNWYVVLTDSAIWVNWKIVKLDEINSISNELNKIENDFEEKIFKHSNLENSKSNFIQNIKSKIWDWYKTIFNNFNWRFLFIVLALYTFYVLIMWVVYIIWSFTIMLFWLLINIISRYILLKSWNEVITINNLFEKIHFESEKIAHEKDLVLINLSNTKNDDWKQWMIKDINSSIENISAKANNAINLNKDLKNKLTNSKYSSIFNFYIYNNWIKKQIKDPLVSIYELLEKNNTMLKNSIESINKEILNSNNEKLNSSLLLQEKRLQMQLEKIIQHKNIIWCYIEKI